MNDLEYRVPVRNLPSVVHDLLKYGVISFYTDDHIRYYVDIKKCWDSFHKMMKMIRKVVIQRIKEQIGQAKKRVKKIHVSPLDVLISQTWIFLQKMRYNLNNLEGINSSNKPKVPFLGGTDGYWVEKEVELSKVRSLYSFLDQEWGLSAPTGDGNFVSKEALRFVQCLEGTLKVKKETTSLE